MLLSFLALAVVGVVVVVRRTAGLEEAGWNVVAGLGFDGSDMPEEYGRCHDKAQEVNASYEGPVFCLPIVKSTHSRGSQDSF